MTARLGAVLILLAFAAAAQQPTPAAVRQAQAEIERYCPGARYGARFLRVANFSPDNRPDYILDLQHVDCPGQGSLTFCGTGGCGVNILVSDGDDHRTAFEDNLRAYRVIPRQGGDVLVISLYGADCGRPGVTRCERSLVYRDGRFVPR